MHTWYQQYYTKWNGMHIPRANFISFHISTCNHFKRFYWHFSVNVNFHGINMTAPKFIFASHILKLYVMRSLSVSVSHTYTNTPSSMSFGCNGKQNIYFYAFLWRMMISWNAKNGTVCFATRKYYSIKRQSAHI